MRWWQRFRNRARPSVFGEEDYASNGVEIFISYKTRDSKELATRIAREMRNRRIGALPQAPLKSDGTLG